LLSAHSNQNGNHGDDIVVSYPVAGRERPETADLVGYFVNNLVVRADLSGDPTFRELIGQVRDKTLDGYAHQGFPLWSLKPESPGRDPFRIIFNLLNASVPAQNLHGLQTSPLHLDIGSEYVFAEVVASLTPADVDLALIMREDGGGLRGLWLYSLEQVDPQAMAAMMHRWARLIEVVTADPDRPASQLRGD
jgi:non-ribosomal peptide synthetase component F